MSSEKVLSVARKAELKPKQYTAHNSWKDNLKRIATKVNLDVEGLHHNSSKETTFDLLVKTYKIFGKRKRCVGCMLLGFRGFTLLFLATAIGASLLFAYTQFTSRPWYFLIFVSASFWLPLYFSYLIGSASVQCSSKKSGSHRRIKIFAKITEVFNQAFDVDGKYYLLKTYVSEVFEYWVQGYSLTVFTCSFPTHLVFVFLVIFALEAFYISYDTWAVTKRGLSVIRRNNRVMVDILLETLTAMIPVIMLRFVYELNFTVIEFFQMALVPAGFALIKIYEMTEAILRERAIECYKMYTKRKERRLSFFVAFKVSADNESIAKLQMKNTPQWLHLSLAVAFSTYGVCLLSLGIIQLSILPNLNCNSGNDISKLWDSCELKVPYCQNIFAPTCDCAILKVRMHNWTALPKQIGAMTALKHVTINNGPLRESAGLMHLVKLRYLNLGHNDLITVPEELGSLSITELWLHNNNLQGLPVGVWGHKNIVDMYLMNNHIVELFQAENLPPFLENLFVSNNSVLEIPSIIKNLKRIRSLAVDGNKISTIPNEVGALSSLEEFKIANNHIRLLPSTFGGMKSIASMDMRNNSIVALPEVIGKLQRLDYLYLENNPICKNGWLDGAHENIRQLVSKEGAGCSKQCSPFFQDRFLEDESCYVECNQASCAYCDGWCL
jgi:hypothetical protein